MAFGFNVTPNATSGAVISGLPGISRPGLFPGLGNREVCVRSNPNCAGGGGGGISLGDTLAGSFTLTFAPATTTLELTDFAVRYQSLGLDGEGSGTGVVVPEAASWAMLIAGFGLVGSALRRRKTRLARA